MKKKILEIGCGQGFYCFWLSKKAAVVGVDISEEDIKTAQKRYPNVDFRVMNSEKLKFPNEEFDEIYALDVLEHVDNLDEVLLEIIRVLKSNGKLHVNVPAEKSEQWLLKIRPTYFDEIHHVRVFKNQELENLMKQHGLSLNKKQSVDFIKHIELYYLFRRKNESRSQLSIGNWRASNISKLVHISLLYFTAELFKTPLKYIPLWLVTFPIGTVVNYFGNKYFPKTISYEFIKT